LPLLPDVALTAFGVAAARASETARPDRLFDDPFAAGFLRAAASQHWSRDRGERRRPEALTAWISVRTRFLDELLLKASGEGARQVVILGAGLDARAFRLHWPERLRLFELDMPGVLEFKAEVIATEGWQPTCERIEVPVDLSEDWSRPLGEAGFDAKASVAWIAEGLLAYLSPEASDFLVARAAELSPSGSRLGITLASARRLQAWRAAHCEGATGTGDYVALWRSAKADQTVEWLAAQGWRAKDYDVAERASAYGRPLDQRGAGATVGAPERNRARLVDAERL
jgi:methyltransferase (TIGR00027 family)